MSAPNTTSAADKALLDARSKGAHTVRITTDLLEMLLGAHMLLADAFREVHARKEASDGQD